MNRYHKHNSMTVKDPVQKLNLNWEGILYNFTQSHNQWEQFHRMHISSINVQNIINAKNNDDKTFKDNIYSNQHQHVTLDLTSIRKNTHSYLILFNSYTC